MLILKHSSKENVKMWGGFNKSWYYVNILCTKRIEYILEGNLLEKSVKRPFCCTVSILQVYFTYLSNDVFYSPNSL